MATLDHIYGTPNLDNDSSDDEEALVGDDHSTVTEIETEEPGSPSKSMASGVLTDVEEEDLEADDDVAKKRDDDDDDKDKSDDEDPGKKTDDDEEEDNKKNDASDQEDEKNDSGNENEDEKINDLFD